MVRMRGCVFDSGPLHQWGSQTSVSGFGFASPLSPVSSIPLITLPLPWALPLKSD